ncbi:MAG: hypothetical protein KKF41_14270 [Actinobacteria bacterium]|nr:hypothetical protein [Actinomycetota bacterium]MBU1942585.1 hypothetical protein [Actinomycetota bacterium]MBU2688739.1 hypothetical protein [Actinomycetota bacterium]
MRRRTAAIAITIIISLALPAAGGCGTRDLSLSTCKDLPVVDYRSVKAISPAYNPTVPVVLVYQDGTVIKKQGPYQFISGKISASQIDELLRTLDGYGFFGLNKVYTGKPLPGGARETLSVVILTGTYTTSTDRPATPANWDKIVKAVMAVPVPGGAAYVPDKIRLHATAAGPPEGAQVSAWPAGAPDLGASAAQPDGMVVTGDTATTAWKELNEGYSSGAAAEPYWSYGGAVYTVFASPVFTGVSPD